MFSFTPEVIRVHRGEWVTLEIASLDRRHGFNLHDFGIRTDVDPGKPARVRFLADKVGTFTFHCDVYCGDGHEEMSGQLIVVD
jgi:cytochrome c oxidase subunit 2